MKFYFANLNKPIDGWSLEGFIPFVIGIIQNQFAVIICNFMFCIKWGKEQDELYV